MNYFSSVEITSVASPLWCLEVTTRNLPPWLTPMTSEKIQPTEEHTIDIFGALESATTFKALDLMH